MLHQMDTSVAERSELVTSRWANLKADANPVNVQRGKYDIENEMVFSSRPDYVFHYSRGLNTGSTEEIEAMKSFLKKRGAGSDLKDRLHAIWYGHSSDTRDEPHVH